MSGEQRGDWRRRFGRAIAWALALKLVALTLLWVFFFSPAHRTEVTPDLVESRLVAPASPVQSDD